MRTTITQNPKTNTCLKKTSPAKSNTIEIRNISKKYSINHAFSENTFRDKVMRKLKDVKNNFLLKQSPSREEFFALEKINLNVRTGTKLGVIGKNGAGKSTLLKLLSKVTYPTTGEIIIRGKTASLLEVGAGFHSELSGRENIYLSGAILGMKKADIDSKITEIISFAELAQFIETPVKKYSSGMQTRLGFSVAAHLKADILIIDEALALGDKSFAEKCVKKMNELSKAGKTIIFVSHNLSLLGKFCDEIIWLKKGEIKERGTNVKKIISEYAKQVE